MSRTLLLPLLPALLAGTALAADLPRPALEIERTAGGGSRVYVRAPLAGGAEQRVLLRETAAAARPLHAGGDAKHAAAFVSWREEGAPDAWFAVSRDAGRTWSELSR